MMQPIFTPASGTSRFVMIDANSLTQFVPIVGVHPLLVDLWALRTHPAVAFTFIFAVGSLGVYMLLPGVNAFSESAVKWFGGPLAGISLVLLASLLSVRVAWWPQIPEDEQVSPVVFAVPAAISLVAALRAVASRRTAVCVLWLAALLASNAVLFLLHGSRFSAGANGVFAIAALAAWRYWLMPAAKVGRDVDEDHSQTAGEPLLACLTGGLLCVVLVTAVTRATHGAGITETERLARTFSDKRAAMVDARAQLSTMIRVMRKRRAAGRCCCRCCVRTRWQPWRARPCSFRRWPAQLALPSAYPARAHRTVKLVIPGFNFAMKTRIEVGMLDYQLLTHSLVVAVVLFALGVVGFLARRNLAIMLISLVIILQGVVLAVESFSTFHGNESGDALSASVVLITFVIAFVMASMIFAIARSLRSLDVSRWRLLAATANDESAQSDSGLQERQPMPSLSVGTASPAASTAKTDGTRGAGD